MKIDKNFIIDNYWEAFKKSFPVSEFIVKRMFNSAIQKISDGNMKLILDYFNNLNFPLTLYRGLRIKEGQEINLKDIGINWTLDDELFFKPSSFSDCNYILTTQVNENEVDFPSTIENFIHYSLKLYDTNKYPELEITLYQSPPQDRVKVYKKEDYIKNNQYNESIKILREIKIGDKYMGNINTQYSIKDAFKSLDILAESETFNVADTDDIVKLGDFLSKQNPDNEIEMIVDVDAENPEELKDSYVGDTILECPTCKTKIYKASEDIVVDEETGLVNIGEVCPLCQSEEGFNVIGKVAPYVETPDEEKIPETTPDETKPEEDKPKEPTEETPPTKDEVKPEEEDEAPKDESLIYPKVIFKLNEKYYAKYSSGLKKISERLYNRFSKIDSILKEDMSFRKSNSSLRKSLEEAIDNSEDKIKYYKDLINKAKKLSIKDGFNRCTEILEQGKSAPVIIKIEDKVYQKWYDQNKDQLDTTLEDETTYITSTNAKAFNPSLGGYSIFGTSLAQLHRKNEFDGADRIENFPMEWMIIDEANIKDLKESVIDTNKNPSLNILIEEFDENKFDDLCNKYIKSIYENVVDYKTNACSIDNNTIIVEGLIKFNSGKETPTKFKFEAKTITKQGKIRLIGMNESFTTFKTAFLLTGNIQDKSIISESLIYNYAYKGNELNEAKKIYGRVFLSEKVKRAYGSNLKIYIQNKLNEAKGETKHTNDIEGTIGNILFKNEENRNKIFDALDDFDLEAEDIKNICAEILKDEKLKASEKDIDEFYEICFGITKDHPEHIKPKSLIAKALGNYWMAGEGLRVTQ